MTDADFSTPITWKESAVLATGQTLDEFDDQFRREREGNWTPPDRPGVGDETDG